MNEIIDKQMVLFDELWERHCSSAGEEQMEIDKSRFKSFIFTAIKESIKEILKENK